MNKFILTVQGYLLHPEKYTKEQLEQNYIDAATDAARIDAIDDETNADWSCQDAADDAASAAYAAAHVYPRVADDWLYEYFLNTGESRQDYIDAIHKENK